MGTCVVACKWPNGMILRLFDMVTVKQPVLGGGWADVLEARVRPGSKTVYIRGPNVPFGTAPRNVEGGYALTFNVDAEFFTEWLKQNAQSDYVMNRIIFAANKEVDAVTEARKMETVKTGIEPIDPNAPPREFRRRQIGDGTGLSGIASESGGAA